MSLTREQVERVARLAELHVPAEELPALATQIARIVDYVGQLGEVGADEEAPPFLAGPAASPLREDVVRPQPLARGPEAFAPEFRDGFFVVPRLGHLEDL
ncbi:MAG TPA: Asp-tRNA(Asn)/Glu-tRNA(Gln) amidotransferase subunit GatC [Gemmatimonadales bacterium]|nr:Asp-tRNA(Asn)/Glu-tRNA(Gln) amidotransferase subunit GatC [Gemmatimonadales bacterium]